MSIGESMQQQAEEFRQRYAAVREQIGRVIVGHDDIVHGVLTCLFVGGHCLLEGVPGLGKTLLVRTLAEALDLKFTRIQFTPDLMPADILGTNMVIGNARRPARRSSSRRGRSSRRSAWPTKSTAPRRRRSRPCSKRCRKARSRVAGNVYRARAAVLRDGHAEPDRAGRHLPAARSAARPLLLQAGRRLLAAARSWRRSSTAPRAASTIEARQGDGRRARS